ncbi:MAG: CoA transferase, partial [Dehalococcoidia bacterium]|nr:CoA transferase [Dehalococcoidia bacterium]
RHDGEPVRMVATPVQFGKTPARIRGLAPELGQHTEEVLIDAGYSWDEIDALRREGAIGPKREEK